MTWSELIHNRAALNQNQTVEQAHRDMLARGIDYAVVNNAEGSVIGMVSFKMVAAALSAKYGQALFAGKSIGQTRVPSVIFGPVNQLPPDQQVPLVIPKKDAAVFYPTFSFFTAQKAVDRREAHHSFDDIIVLSETGAYEGMISMRRFQKLQMDVMQWQEKELLRRNDDLNRTLNELSQAQVELVNSAKMAALGELVAGIAHEMNTPLGVLINSHDMIEKVFNLLTPEVTPERRAQLSHLLRTNIDLSREASERVGHIIRSLRTFGREDHEERYNANLVDLIDSSLVLLSSKFKSGITVQTDLVDAAPVPCYPGQISQVLVNILTNAYQAMNGKGEITIELLRGKTAWELSIRDHGPGVPHQLMDRIFDPGFTTKGVGVGTGLGLFICKKIIEQNHQGRISVTNHPQGGAIFYLELPLTSPTSKASSEPLEDIHSFHWPIQSPPN